MHDPKDIKNYLEGKKPKRPPDPEKIAAVTALVFFVCVMVAIVLQVKP